MSWQSIGDISAKLVENLSKRRTPPMRDPIEFVEPQFQVYHPHHTDLIGRGDTEEEAHADLQAQIEEIREKHLLRHPFEACGCIVCDPARHLKPTT